MPGLKERIMKLKEDPKFIRYVTFGILWWFWGFFWILLLIDLFGWAGWQYIAIFTVPNFLIKFLVYDKKIFKEKK